MKRFLKTALLGFITILALTGSVNTHAAANAEKEVDILFLHDTHSHLNSFSTLVNGETVITGGFARIKTLMNEAKEVNPDTLVLDAGDFSMGTLVQTIYDSEASELRMLGAMGIDVTTLGNHEFDYRTEGLANMLSSAIKSGDPLPQMVLCNIDWETMEQEGLSEEQLLLKKAFDSYGMKDYTVIEKGNVNIAVFGVFGKDSLAYSPTCVLKFNDPSEAAAKTVAKIKADENVDLIVCVSHSGTEADEKKSEDEILAKNVPDIDLIISGHSHTSLENYIRHGDTYIASCGEYGKNLGSISMRQREDGRWEVTAYKLNPVTPDIPKDPSIQEKIDHFMEIVDSSYLSQFGYTRKQIVAQNDITLCSSLDLYQIHTEHNLGNLLSDAFRYMAEYADTGDDHPIDVAIVPSGCVRDTFTTGDITVEDVFNAYSLGIGEDGIPGYPLISVYLTGSELKTVAEIDATVSDFMHPARLYMSGMNFRFHPRRILLNKVTECYLTDDSGNTYEPEDDRLYRVVCDLYSGQMLGAVSDVSYGILSVVPKFADGTPIENIEDAIILSNGSELKAWAAIASYLDSFEDTDGDGISNIPDSYGEIQGRKQIDDSKNPISLIKHLNKYSVIILLIVIVLIIIVIMIIRLLVHFIRKLIQRKKHRN